MPEVLQNIKDNLDEKLGSPITVIAQAGRKKNHYSPRCIGRNLSVFVRCRIGPSRRNL